jgi:hypothetical protein
MTNARHLRGSAWLNFQRVKCEQWSLFNGKSHVVLMGDAVHTAHFAIGSGTKLAIEDAIELTRLFVEMGDTAAHMEVLARYQEVRNVEVLKLQNAAWNAMAWFEVCGERYCDRFEPQQFMYSMLTRSQRISHENLRLRDAKWLEGYEAWLAGGNRQREQLLFQEQAADAHALEAASSDAEEPHRRLAHGAVQRGGRRGAGLPPGAPGRARAGRRGAGDGRDDQPDARGPHHPGCPGLWNDAQSGGLQAHRGLRARPAVTLASACSSATAAPRARPASAGKATTSRCPTATGR